MNPDLVLLDEDDCTQVGHLWVEGVDQWGRAWMYCERPDCDVELVEADG